MLTRSRRQSRGIPTFKSVILAGVTDIKSLKRKIRPDEAHKFNSPWNIAADFNIDMSLSVEGITVMLDEYENDHHTEMNTAKIAQEIFDYTSGYPFLVSRIWQFSRNLLKPAKFWCRYSMFTADNEINQLKRHEFRQ